MNYQLLQLIRAYLNTIADNQLDIAEWYNDPELDDMQKITLDCLENLLELVRRWEQNDIVKGHRAMN